MGHQQAEKILRKSQASEIHLGRCEEDRGMVPEQRLAAMGQMEYRLV